MYVHDDGIGAAMARAHQRERYCLCSACSETNNRVSARLKGLRLTLRVATARKHQGCFCCYGAGKRLWVTQINWSKWRKRFLCTHFTLKWTVREANFILLLGAFPCFQLVRRAGTSSLSLPFAIDAASARTALAPSPLYRTNRFN